MIGELQIKLGDGELPRGYEEQHFVYELLRCVGRRDTFSINDVMVSRLKKLTLTG